MSKRFIDSDMWNKRWIRLLRANYKLFWVYVLSRCDHAGIWEVDIELASFQLGIELNRDELLFVFKDKLIEINDGNKWFILGYIDFQYGELNPANRVHNSVLKILKRYKIQEGYKIQGAYKPLKSSSEGAKVKVKDKDIDKAKDIQQFNFEEIWSKYPRKKGKERARVHFNAQIKSKEGWININKALDNYLDQIKRLGTEEQHIQHGSTWFNHSWMDDVNYSAPPKPVFDEPIARGM